MNNIEEQIAQEAYFLKYKYSSPENVLKRLKAVYESIIGMLSVDRITQTELNRIFRYIDKEYEEIFKEAEGLSEEEIVLLAALFVKSEAKLLNTKFSNNFGKDVLDFKNDTVMGYKLRELVNSVKVSSKTKLKNIIKANAMAEKDIKTYRKDIKASMSEYPANKLTTALFTYAKFTREKIRTFTEKKTQITGWISLAILDSKTSALCIKLNREVYPIEKYKARSNIPSLPPRHFNCRSVVVRTTEIKKDLADSGVTFTEFLKSNESVAVNLLGQKRNKLFQEGRLDIKRFIGRDGNWIKLKDLEKIIS